MALRGVAEVVDAGGLAAAAVRAVLERHDHDVLFLENKSGDAKRRAQPQLLHLDAELQRGHQ